METEENFFNLITAAAVSLQLAAREKQDDVPQDLERDRDVCSYHGFSGLLLGLLTSAVSQEKEKPSRLERKG